jgi:hypothetical protein
MAAPKTRTGIWFATAVLVALGFWFGGNELYTRLVILPRQHPRLEPGSVSLIGMKVPGYRIVVSNGVARLSIGEPSTFARPEEMGSDTGKPIPIKGLMGTLRFEPESAAELILAMNEIEYDIQPLPDRVWTHGRVKSALASPSAERDQLEYDLATNLSGGGIERVSWDRLTTGIWLEVPVPLSIPAAEGTKQLIAKVLVPYKTRLAIAAENYFKRQVERGGLSANLRPTPGTVAGVYDQALKDVGGQEDVAETLADRFDPSYAASLAEPVLKIVREVEVLVTESTIKGAHLEAAPRDDGKGDFYTIEIETDETSRDRMWQYTYRRPGSQLLLVSNGVAIAAPVVRHEIKFSTVEISGITERRLAEEALQFIKEAAGPPRPPARDKVS